MIKLRDYQNEVVEKGLPILREHRILMLFAEVRVGKTLMALSIAREYGAGAVLFITKKKAIPSIQADYDKLQPGYFFAVINYESIHKITKDGWDLIIIDESHSLGALPRPSKRTKLVKEYVGHRPMILLSGTPTPENYSQIFHQLWVSNHSPWRRYANFYRWANAGYVQVYERWIAGSPKKQYDRASKAMIDRDINHLILSVSQEDAGFEMLVDESVIWLPMPEVLMEVYDGIDNEGVYFNDEWAVAASSAADRINKLSQVCGGSLITDEGTRILSYDKAAYIASGFKGQKIAILYKYQGEREILEDVFSGRFTDVPEQFNATDVPVFLGQIQSVREGVNLKEADCIVMYNIDFSATSYYQARARLQSKDRDTPAKVYWLFYEGGIEECVYKAVQGKRNFTSSYYNKAKKELSTI